MKKTSHNNFEQDVIKSLKRSAREEYRFQPTRIVRSKKKYDRKRNKMEFLKEYSKTPFSLLNYYLNLLDYV